MGYGTGDPLLPLIDKIGKSEYILLSNKKKCINACFFNWLLQCICCDYQ